MTHTAPPSEFRVEKRRVEATVTLSSGESALGCFFVAGGSARHEGPERVGELLNAETGFFPFERHDGGPPRTVLYNRAHLVVVELAEPEAQRVSGYEVATRRSAFMVLSNGRRVIGTVRVYRPEGRDRISDWARDALPFRYVETQDATLLVNVQHVVEVSEIEEPSEGQFS
jgi:hypothetical protein